MRDSYLKRTYGIDSKQYDEMLATQDYKCAICGKTEDTLLDSGVNKSLAVDHNHETGEIRGILCENCNRGIGLLQEDVEILENSIKYLNQF